MAKNLLDELKATIKDQTNKTPGLVGNLHGTVETVVTSREDQNSHTWYVLGADVKSLPSVREFADAFSFQRLPISEISAVQGIAHFPDAGTIPQGRATTFFSSLALPAADTVPVSVTAPGHQIAVYVNDGLVAKGSGLLTASLKLGSGSHFIAIICFGGTQPITIDVPAKYALTKAEPTPPAPLWGSPPTTDYLKAENGSYIVTLEWQNDPYASAWQVYRSEAVKRGVVTQFTPGDVYVTVRVDQVLDDVVAGNDFFTDQFYGGQILTVTPGVDYTDLEIALDGQAPTDAPSWLGLDFFHSTEIYHALSRLTYSGSAIITFRDTTGQQGSVYLYRVTAFGFITGTAESDYSLPEWALVDDLTAPGSIAFTAESDITIVNGEVHLIFTSPADSDYAGVKVYRDNGGNLELVQTEFGDPNERDALAFRPSVPDTYWFRSFDTSGNIQPGGVSWVWDGTQNYARAVVGLLTAVPNAATGNADLTLAVTAATASYPITAEFYKGSLDPAGLITLDTGVTQHVFNADGSTDKNQYPGLGNIALNPGLTPFWAKLTDRDGHVTYAQASLTKLVLDGDVKLVLDETGAVELHVSQGAGTPLSFGYTHSNSAFDFVQANQTLVNFSSTEEVVPLTALNPGQKLFVVVWLYQAVDGGGQFSTPKKDQVVFISADPNPFFDYLIPVRDLAILNEVRIDVSIRIEDPSASAGTLKVWVNKDGTASADPTTVPDATFAIVSTPAAVGPADWSFLHDILSNNATDKLVYFEFVNAAGASTGKKELKLPQAETFVTPSGDLSDGVVDIPNFVSGVRPPRFVNALPASGDVVGDLVVLLTDPQLRMYRWTGTEWTAAVDTSDLTGTIATAQIADGAIDLSKIFGDVRSTLGLNFVTNGNAETGTNLNFPSLTAVAIDGAPSGKYVFERTSGATTNLASDYIAVDTDLTYVLAASARYTGAVQPHMFVGLQSFDKDKIEIQSQQVWSPDGTLRTLTQDAVSGTNVVFLDDVSGFNTTVDYVAMGAQADESDVPNRNTFKVQAVDTVAKKLTLTTNLTQPFLTGTKARRHSAGGTYVYTAANNVTLNTTFTRYSGQIGGIQALTGTISVNKFRKGTKYIRPVLLLNYSDATAKTTQIGDIEFTLVTDTVHITDNAITAPKIATNAVLADKIIAGAITASKLFIGAPGAALNSDPSPSDLVAWPQSIGGSAAQLATVSDGKVGNRVLKNTAGVGSRPENLPFIPVDPAKTYRIRAWYRRTAVDGNGSFYLGVDLRDSSGTIIAGDGTFWYYPVSNVSPTIAAGWQEGVGTFGAGTSKAIPASARTMAPVVLLAEGGTSGVFEVQDVRIEEVLPGTLIRDGAIVTNHMTANSINGDRITVGTLNADRINASWLTAGVINAGAIGVNELAAHSVSLEKLFVGSYDNLVLDPGFENTSVLTNDDGWTGNGTVAGNGGTWSLVTTSPRSGSKALQYNPVGQAGVAITLANGKHAVQGKHVACTEGDQFYFEAWTRKVGTGTAPQVRLETEFRKTDGTSAGTPVGTVLVPTQIYQKITITATAPAGSAWVEFIIRVELTGGATELVLFDDAYARRMVTGSIVVDGTITAAKVQVGTLTGDRIAANQITGSHIQAGQITGNHLAVATLSELKPDLGIITNGVLRNSADTRYLNLNADGTGVHPDFLHHEAIQLKNDGTAQFSGVFAGTITAATFTGGAMDFNNVSAIIRFPSIAGGFDPPGFEWQDQSAGKTSTLTSNGEDIWLEPASTGDVYEVSGGTTYRLAKVIASTSTPSGAAPEGTIWAQY